MKQTHHIGYVQTPSVKNLSNVKNALVENGLVPLTTPNEMLPDAIEKGLKTYNKDFGMIHEGKYRIRYFDIDGTILKIEYVEDGGKLTPPAKTPNYDPDYLIFDEWNYDIENYIVEQPTDVGATYKTVDDATYMLCRFTTATGLNPTLAISGFTSIDWGDDIVNTSASHTYTKEGNYVIKIKGEFSTSTSTSKYLLGSTTLMNALNKCYLSSKITLLSNYVFRYAKCLEVMSLPKTLTGIYNNVWETCYNLNGIVIPQNVTSLFSYSFSSRINFVCWNDKIKGISERLLDGNSIKDLIITNKMTNTGLYSCRSSYTKNLYLGKNLTYINEHSFENLLACQNIFISGNVPSIYSNSFTSSILNTCTIWVKDEKLETAKTKAHWSNYASIMKPLSWYPHLTDPNAE